MWMQDDTFYNALQWFKANQPVDSAANYVLHDRSGKSLGFSFTEPSLAGGPGPCVSKCGLIVTF